MADHSKPLITSTYANFVSELDSRFDDLTLGLDPAVTSPTNLPTGAIRWNSASSKWEKWSGTAWADLASSYNINLSGPLTLTANSASDALRITQTGAGNSLVVEDSANPDSSPFVIDGTGNVGIGKTTPSAKLDVSGSVAYTGTLTGGTGIINIGSGQIYKAADGSVGFGTTAPAAQVEVSSGSSLSAVPAVLLTAPSQTSSTLKLSLSGAIPTIESTGNNLNIKAATGNSTKFYINTTEVMRVASNAAVGIGITSPLATLHVSQTQYITNTSGNTAGLEIAGNGGTPGVSGLLLRQNADTSALVWNRANAPLTFGTASAERVHIAANGNVGIGATPGSMKLDVNGDIRSLANSVYITPSADPTQNALLRLTNTGGNAYVGLDNSAGGLGAAYALHMYHSGAYPIVFTTNGTQRMRIAADGKVGIGTTTPATTLDVYGALNIQSNNNLTWGGVYGANIPTIAGASGAVANLQFYPAGSTSGVGMMLSSNNTLMVNTTSNANSRKLLVNGSNNAGDYISVVHQSITSNEFLFGQQPVNNRALIQSSTFPIDVYVNGGHRVRVGDAGVGALCVNSTASYYSCALAVSGDIEMIGQQFNAYRSSGDIELVQRGAGGWIFYTDAGSKAPFRIAQNGTLLTGLPSAPSSLYPMMSCRAWANINGNAAPAVANASGNVSSITDNGTGDYSVNFTTAMPDAAYSVGLSAPRANGRYMSLYGTTFADFSGANAMSTAYVRIILDYTPSSTLADANNISVQIFR